MHDEVEQLIKDARRYRWLRLNRPKDLQRPTRGDIDYVFVYRLGIGWCSAVKEELDFAIDAAIAKEEEQHDAARGKG